MSTAIKIPSPLRQFAGGRSHVETTANTVDTALDDLARQFPLLHSQIYQDGRLRQFINVFVNGDNIRDLDGPQTPITPNDTVFIIPSIAGG